MMGICDSILGAHATLELQGQGGELRGTTGTEGIEAGKCKGFLMVGAVCDARVEHLW